MMFELRCTKYIIQIKRIGRENIKDIRAHILGFEIGKNGKMRKGGEGVKAEEDENELLSTGVGWWVAVVKN